MQTIDIRNHSVAMIEVEPGNPVEVLLSPGAIYQLTNAGSTQLFFSTHAAAPPVEWFCSTGCGVVPVVAPVRIAGACRLIFGVAGDPDSAGDDGRLTITHCGNL